MADFENSQEIPKVITFLSSLLQRVAEMNDFSRHLDSQKISIFHGLTRPTISVNDYLQRIFKYAYCSPSCYITAYIYLDRFAKKQPLLPINSFNVHRLLITSVLVSAKFMDDIFYNNAYYAKVGGISTEEMNLLEVDFLFGLGFQLNVTPQTFHTYCCYIQREILQHSPPLHFPPSSNLDHYYINEDGPTHQQQSALQLIHNLV
ncbi:unnamed protein product [Fraxinus pennsylvanica]|uniref:Cyclin n=1 Tax=Fraxinus pennsylvanica TaxID=56036 RepID=A0AAD2DYP5_9LAMI|nr:unnamed protein product [Fraxinus pennsylvanica]